MMALLAMSPVLLRASNPFRSGLLRTSAAAVFMVLTIGLVGISGSRGSYISLIITLAAFSVWRSSRKWARLGFASLALGILMLPYIFETTIDRFVELSGDSVLGEREVIWQAAWQMITEHPWTGVGIGNSSYSVMSYLNMASSVGKDGVSLHNPIFVIWSETGILGLVLYLAVPFSAIVSFIGQYLKFRKQADHALIPYFAFVGALFLGYMASWVKGGGMETDFIYFLVLALLLIPSCLQLETHSVEPSVPYPLDAEVTSRQER
jgi:O-antigen ligase